MRSLVLFVTDRCNLACTYCYQSRSKDRLEWSAVEKALGHWLEQSPGALTVSFFGGEPLLDWPLVRRSMEKALELSRRHGKPLRFAVATNATVLTEEMIETVERVGMRVQVSLDGPAGVHDRHRGRGTFDKVLAAISRLKRSPKIHLKTSTVVTPENVGELFSSLSFMWSLDLVEMKLHFDLTAQWEEHHFDELKRQYARLIPAALAYHRRHGYFPHAEFQLQPERLFPFKCNVSRRTLVLKGDGNVYGCTYHAPEWRGRRKQGPPPLAVATLQEILTHGLESDFVTERLKAVNDSPHQAPLENRYTDARHCADCPYLFRCGACHATAYSFGKDPLWLPQSRCHLTELNHRYALLLDAILKAPEKASALTEPFLQDPMVFSRPVPPPSNLLPLLEPQAACSTSCRACRP